MYNKQMVAKARPPNLKRTSISGDTELLLPGHEQYRTELVT
jgi:hypothetical protein